MKIQIKNKQPFQVLDTSFAATLPSGTFELFMSADGISYSKYDGEITAPDTLVVNGVTKGMYFYFTGIADEITVLI